MRKKILTIAFLLIFTAGMLGLPWFALAADELSFNADTTIVLDNGMSFTIIAGSLADEMSVYSSYMTFTLSANSSVEIRSSDRYLFNSLAETDCNYNSSYSRKVLGGSGTQTTITITPSTETCPSWGSTGGGGGAAPEPTTPSKPTTTTGQVTATPSGGGKTTLTTNEENNIIVDLPANAVSSSTEIKIVADEKAEVVSTRSLPSGKSIAGGYAYNLTATANGMAVATFSKDVTLTFTYTDTQISDLNEDSLKIYYWDGSKWSALTSTLDKANNKITAATNHFTYFVILGDSAAKKMADPKDYGLKEGDLIRAEGDWDVFIVNQFGYKRLFLNPTIFNMYGHLGGWKAVKTVTKTTRDAFVTSHHYRYVDSPKVYLMKVTGEDTGTLHWINMTAENYLSQGGNANAIFTINKKELDWYSKGADVTSL
ncbi:MAG: hypothetical protein ACOZAL_03330 [Patescibacteria group bacterium]